jgi:hypothetical protein
MKWLRRVDEENLHHSSAFPTVFPHLAGSMALSGTLLDDVLKRDEE